MAWNKIGNLAALSLALIFAACGEDSKSSSSEAEISLREVQTIYDLGACTKDRNGDTVLVIDKAVEYLCIGKDWLDITTQNTDVPQSSESEGYSSSESIPSSENLGTEHFDVSSSSVANDPLSPNFNSSSSTKLTYIEVSNKDKLIVCDSANINMHALVLADSSYYTCKASGWAKDTVYLGYDIVNTKEDLGVCNIGNAKLRVLVKKDSVFFNCDSVKWEPETVNGYVINNISVIGSAHKGPFKLNSPLELREVLLHNDSLVYSGRKYVDKISSNAGDFAIPKVSMIYPYAVLEVRGLWRNEVTGEWSKDSMTFRALTELSEKANVNLLTHLEYDRAINLINKGYSVSAAKTEADYEIMTAFEIAPTMSNSEAKETFGSEADPTLLAMAVLFIGNRSDSEINKAINSFKADIADDGIWDDEKTKAEMADWAEGVDYSVIRANVKNWNISVIPDFEVQLETFWNNAYGLGNCGQNHYNVVTPVMNSLSVNYGVHYVCKTTGWQKATDYEKDTYQWADGANGDVKKGNVTDTYYTFNGTKWVIAARENAIGLCSQSKEGTLEKYEEAYYICKSNVWEVAATLEYDTYQFGKGEDGEVRQGKVNADKFYVYENGAWRESANEIENNLGACVTSREGVVEKSGGVYYICKSKNWGEATMLEYDTYGWTNGIEGEVKVGNVNTDMYYVYTDSKWQVASSIEKDLNGCTTSREGVVGKSGSIYYICKSKNWVEATELEYDTYGKLCNTDGSIVDGKIISTNKYVCDIGSFRKATEQEIDLNKGCVSYTENEIIRKQLSDTIYTCQNNLWIKSIGIYGTLKDTRDNKTYKTVIIGNQTWMAENLNYSDSSTYVGMKRRSWCYDNKVDSCTKYGRLYTWAAAMDSAGMWSTKGKWCGYGKTCTIRTPVRGICPEGWHLPDTTEWRTLYKAMESSPHAMQAKGFRKWYKATDTSGFSALPAGSYYYLDFSGVGSYATFWSATEYNHSYAYQWCLNGGNDYGDAYFVNEYKNNGSSVRCLKDSD